MKQKSVLIILLLGFFIAKNLHGQIPNFEWAKSGIGSYAENAANLASDKFGNTYLIGTFWSSTLIFGTDTLFNQGSADIYIVKFNNQGNIVWAKSCGGNSDDGGGGVCCDSIGNIYIAGSYRSTITNFNNLTINKINPSVSAEMCLAKYDSNGNAIWVKQVFGDCWVSGGRLKVDDNNNIFVIGSGSAGTYIDFGAVTISNSPFATTAFLAKYDTSGNLLWVHKSEPSKDSYFYSLAADQNGNCYVVGHFDSTLIKFDTITLYNQGNILVNEIFIVKYDFNGNVAWAKSIHGSGDDQCFDIACNKNGELAITGYFKASLYHGIDTFTTQGLEDIFLAKLDTSGVINWITSRGGTGSDGCWNVAIDNAGNTIIGGFFSSPSISFDTINLTLQSTNNDLFVVEFNNSGNATWAKHIFGDDYGGISNLQLNSENDILLCGAFNGTQIMFDTIVLPNQSALPSSLEAYIAKIKNYKNELGLNSISQIDSTIIFPNPSRNRIYFKNKPRNCKVSLFDEQGKFIKYTYDDELSILNLNAGMYYVKYDGITKKVMVY
jgi:hypothetical protein